MSLKRLNGILGLQTQLYIVTLCGFLLGFSTGLWQPLLNIYLDSVGIPILWIGAIATIQGAVSSVTMLPSGTLSDLIGRRKPIILSLILTGSVLLSLLLVRDVLLFFLVFSIQGLALGLRSPNFPAYIADAAKRKAMGVAYASFSFFTILAMTGGTAIGAYIADLYGFPASFEAAAVSCFLAVVFAFFFLKESMKEKTRKVRSSLKKSVVNSIPALTGVLRNRRLTLLLASVTLHHFFVQIIFPYLALYMNSHLGYTLTTVGLVLSIRRFGFLAGQLPSGKFIDRYGPELSLFIHIFLTAPLLFFFVTSGNILILTLTMIAWGLAGGMDTPSQRILVVNSSGSSERASTLGAVQSFAGIVSLASPIVGAWLWNNFSPQSPFFLSVMGNVVASIPVLFLLLKRKLSVTEN